MEFCGGCGKELGRGLDRGRFCAACGHENPGNARYPLYAERAAAGAVTPVAAPTTSMMSLMSPVPAGDLTSVRLPAVSETAPTTEGERPVPTAWRTTVLAALVTMLVLALLGVVLILY